jgi:RHS repeat-associated protein
VQPDHLGTPRVVIDPIRDVAIWEWSSKSEVFGNQVPNVDADGDGIGFELALRFPGQQATDASGMFYNYQREYDPAVGRYSQSDPIGLGGGINSYLYVSAAPTLRVDPEGLVDVWVWMPLPYEGGLPSYGKLHSSFGHVSSTALGTDYSFGPGGNSVGTDYVTSQLELRAGIKHTLNMSPEKEAAVGACLAKAQGKYSALMNNCATPIQNCLREIGSRCRQIILCFRKHLITLCGGCSTVQLLSLPRDRYVSHNNFNFYHGAHSLDRLRAPLRRACAEWSGACI